jgi:hypothetical protein
VPTVLRNLPPRKVARRIRAFVALSLALGLVACGLGVVYPRLDSVAAHYVESLVTLDRAQSRLLEHSLSTSLEWHRKSELNQYSGFLRGLAGDLEAGPDAVEWQRASAQTERYWREVLAQAAPGYARVAATLTDAQVAELIGNLERQDAERQREYSKRSPERRRLRREKSVRRAIEHFTGPLTTEQRNLVSQYARTTSSLTEQWLENRRVWRGALAAALAVRHDHERFEPLMLRLIARPDELWTPQYRAAFDARRAEILALLGELDATLTVAQREEAGRELVSLADELQGLARHPG